MTARDSARGRLRGPAVVGMTASGLALAVVLTGCLPAGPDPVPSGAAGSTTTPAAPAPLDRSPAAVGEAHESEVPAGWDEPGDEPVVPVEELDADSRRALIRVQASSDPMEGACTADQLGASVRYTDAAMGHRYGFVTVTNEGPGPCALRGYPGFGARGAWGNPFVNEVEQSPMESAGQYLPAGYEPGNVALAVGDSARVQLEWTGALGGSGSEPLGDMLLQPFHGTDPIPVTGAAEEAFDLSMFTTVKVGPFLNPVY